MIEIKGIAVDGSTYYAGEMTSTPEGVCVVHRVGGYSPRIVADLGEARRACHDFDFFMALPIAGAAVVRMAL